MAPLLGTGGRNVLRRAPYIRCMRAGTPEHRELFCRTFIDTHVTFEPEQLPWPQLEGRDLTRLRAFPFWRYARSIEQRAGRMVSAFAETITDPLIHRAVALQGVEETRHGRLMAHAIERYGIDAPPLTIADAPISPEEFAIFGFGECTDSFVGFGAIALARDKGILPAALLDVFDGVMFEEARHIAFFINWWRYEQALAGRGAFGAHAFKAFGYHLRAAMGTVTGATDLPPMPKLDDPELSEIVAGVTPAMFLTAALAENRRMMAKLDRRLIKPALMPTFATLLLLAIRMLPPRAVAAAAAALQPLAPERSRSAA